MGSGGGSGEKAGPSPVVVLLTRPDSFLCQFSHGELALWNQKVFHKESCDLQRSIKVCRLTLDVQGGSNFSQETRGQRPPHRSEPARSSSGAACFFLRRSKLQGHATPQERRLGRFLRLKDSPCCLGGFAARPFSVPRGVSQQCFER